MRLTKRFPLFGAVGVRTPLIVFWVFLVAFLFWSLGQKLFPFYEAALSTGTYWTMGAVALLGILGSIVFHDLVSLGCAAFLGQEPKGVTPFIFGSFIEVRHEPESPGKDALFGVCALASNLALGLLLLALSFFGNEMAWPRPVLSVLFHLAAANLTLAVFNLLPAFPLAGGRILRAVLWKRRRDLVNATLVAVQSGLVISVALSALGIFLSYHGRPTIGAWTFLTGVFLGIATDNAYKGFLVRIFVSGKKVRELMDNSPVVIPATARLQALSDYFVSRFRFHAYPVERDHQLVGYVTVRSLTRVPRSLWKNYAVNEVAHKLTADTCVAPETDGLESYFQMNRTGNRTLMVTEAGRLYGILSFHALVDAAFRELQSKIGGAA